MYTAVQDTVVQDTACTAVQDTAVHDTVYLTTKYNTNSHGELIHFTAKTDFICAQWNVHFTEHTLLYVLYARYNS